LESDPDSGVKRDHHEETGVHPLSPRARPEQAQRPEPLSAMIILAYHDTVELFLVLAGEQAA
jgi:hypothetical protein